MTTNIAIERAQAEFREAREAFERARDAILAKVVDSPGLVAAPLIKDVSTETGIDEVTVQRALWALVHDRAVRLGDDLEAVL